jgi:hypothetical protein
MKIAPDLITEWHLILMYTQIFLSVESFNGELNNWHGFLQVCIKLFVMKTHLTRILSSLLLLSFVIAGCAEPRYYERDRDDRPRHHHRDRDHDDHHDHHDDDHHDNR